jgi:hypothetical protein
VVTIFDRFGIGQIAAQQPNWRGLMSIDIQD